MQKNRAPVGNGAQFFRELWFVAGLWASGNRRERMDNVIIAEGSPLFKALIILHFPLIIYTVIYYYASELIS